MCPKKRIQMTHRWGRQSPRRVCAGAHSNNYIPSGRRPSLAILRPGDSRPLPVPAPETVDFRAVRLTDVLLQRAEPGLQLTTSLPAPVRKRHRVDDVTDDFARGTASSMPELSEPAL